MSDLIAKKQETKVARGSKPGERRGGRVKGTKNKRTAAVEAAVSASGLTPLEYMLKVMRDDQQSLATRMDAAKGAAPYVHAKLASVEHNGNILMQHTYAERLAKARERADKAGK